MAKALSFHSTIRSPRGEERQPAHVSFYSDGRIFAHALFCGPYSDVGKICSSLAVQDEGAPEAILGRVRRRPVGARLVAFLTLCQVLDTRTQRQHELRAGGCGVM